MNEQDFNNIKNEYGKQVLITDYTQIPYIIITKSSKDSKESKNSKEFRIISRKPIK